MQRNIVTAPIRKTLRWAVSLVSIAYGLLYLNSAAFYAWVATGPPNQHPDLWMRQARWQFMVAAGLIAVGAAVIWFFRPRGPFGAAT
jgi:hypothetical protein